MQRVFIGMSGGIDSSAAALLLVKEGFDVTGVTFTALREEGTKKCCSIEEITSASTICKALNIPHKIIDVKDVFQAKIIRYFLDSYKSGLTPNPCVFCNRFVKFGALLEYSLSEGADFFATGHYARIEKDEDEYFIRKGADTAKDQSYFLSYIEKEKLPHIKLPLGGLTKPEVRKIVEESGMPINSKKSESQDICFVPGDYRDFLASQGVPEIPGDFIYQGKKIGTHRGIPFYSMGQRRGLKIAVGERTFVREIDPAKNRLVLGDKPVSKEFTAGNLNTFTKNFTSGNYDIQIRYHSRILKGEIELNGNQAEVKLSEPQEIVSPGQFAVFYRNDRVFASGIIEKAKLL